MPRLEQMQFKAHAKLTLSLKITGTRPDGYHTIEADMASLDLADVLVASPAEKTEIFVKGNQAQFIPTGPENLVFKALEATGRRARVEIQKNIPLGAGLGGGSSDAAAILRWVWGEDESKEPRDKVKDFEVAVGIGADVAFCLAGGRAVVLGIGEVIQPLEFQPAVYSLLTPPFGCSTRQVYEVWDKLGGPQGDAGNDLEPAALEAFPHLAEYRDKLGEISGLRPRLAGSGSTWFVEGEYEGEGLVVARTVPAGWS